MGNITQQISILVDVQGVELEMLHTGRQIDALSAEAIALDRQATERQALVGDEKTVLDDLKKAYRDLESESKVSAEAIVKSDAKLRAVKTNKEYQSILKEIDEFRKKISGLEDQMLEHLDRIDTCEKTITDKEAQLKGFIQSCQEQKATLTAKEARERKVMEALNDKKSRICAEADPKILNVLEEVKKKVRGAAVVPVQGAICLGCHMNIPAQLSNELQRCDQLRFCPHCHRIIYWKAKDND